MTIFSQLARKLREFFRLQKDTDAVFPEGSPFAVLGGGGPAGYYLRKAAALLTPGKFEMLVHHVGRNNRELGLTDKLALSVFRRTGTEGEPEQEYNIFINHQAVGFLRSNGECLALILGGRTSHLLNAHDLLQLNEGESHLMFDILTGVVHADARVQKRAEIRLRKLALEVETYRSDLDCE